MRRTDGQNRNQNQKLVGPVSDSLGVELDEVGVDGWVRVRHGCNQRQGERRGLPWKWVEGECGCVSPDCGRDVGGSTGLGCIRMKGSSTDTSLQDRQEAAGTGWNQNSSH